MNAENTNPALPKESDVHGTTTEEPRVLVVEDNDALRQGYERQLVRAGYRVVAVGRISEARAHIADRNESFEAAVLDYALPDGDALELISALLQREPLCKSLVVTGVGGHGEARTAVRKGAHAFLEKPVKPAALVAGVMGTVYATLAWRKIAQQGAKDTEELRDATEWGGPQAPTPLALEPDELMARLRYIAGLTPTETLVAYRLLWGDSDRQIAELLGYAERTAKRHVGHVLRKTGAKTRSGLLGVLLRDAGKGTYAADPGPEARERPPTATVPKATQSSQPADSPL